MKNTIKLLTDSICQVPFQVFQRDFTFIINGEKFQTNKIIADLLSPKISKMHQADPTINTYSLNTKSKGNFQILFDLLTFQTNDLPDSDLSFFSEVIENFETEKIAITIPDTELNLENIIEIIKNHEKLPFFHKTNLINEFDFLSEHFYELSQDQITELCNLKEESIEKIISNDKLTLTSEDQLMSFINFLCLKNLKFSKFFDYVYFKNLSDETIFEFFNTIDIEHLTKGTWISLSKRFSDENETNKKRYIMNRNSIVIAYSNNNLKGIFSLLRSISNIMDEVNVTCSHKGGGNETLLLNIENKERNLFYTYNEQNSWFCFEFKNYNVIPSHYTIKSIDVDSDDRHPKSWIIEGSENKENWIEIDNVNNCSFLNGSSLIHAFQVNKQNKSQKAFKYLRIRQTGTNCHGDYYFYICSIEFYGQLIKTS